MADFSNEIEIEKRHFAIQQPAFTGFLAIFGYLNRTVLLTGNEPTPRAKARGIRRVA